MAFQLHVDNAIKYLHLRFVSLLCFFRCCSLKGEFQWENIFFADQTFFGFHLKIVGILLWGFPRKSVKHFKTKLWTWRKKSKTWNWTNNDFNETFTTLRDKKENPAGKLEVNPWKFSLFLSKLHRASKEKVGKFAQSPKMILVFKQRRCAVLQSRGKIIQNWWWTLQL